MTPAAEDVSVPAQSSAGRPTRSPRRRRPFESAGYAFSTVVHHIGDHEVLDILETELSRAVFSPFGHITWTALLGGALFAAAASHEERFQVTGSVVGTFAGIVLLHGA